MECPKCGEPISPFHKFCSHCGGAVNGNPEEHGYFVIDHDTLEEGVRSGRIKIASKEETCAHVIRGLINYHERMTMGNYPDRDFYLDALKFALACVEEKIEKQGEKDNDRKIL